MPKFFLESVEKFDQSQSDMRPSAQEESLIILELENCMGPPIRRSCGGEHEDCTKRNTVIWY